MDIEQKAVDAEGDDAERSRLTQALVKVRNSASLAGQQTLLNPKLALNPNFEQSRSHTSPGEGARLCQPGRAALWLELTPINSKT